MIQLLDWEINVHLYNGVPWNHWKEEIDYYYNIIHSIVIWYYCAKMLKVKKLGNNLK